MVRSNLSHLKGKFYPVNHPNYTHNQYRTISKKFSLSQGGRKGKPAQLPGRKGGNSVIGFVEFLGFMGLTAKNPMNSINPINSTNPDFSPTEASRSCELSMELKLETENRKATKGGYDGN